MRSLASRLLSLTVISVFTAVGVVLVSNNANTSAPLTGQVGGNGNKCPHPDFKAFYIKAEAVDGIDPSSTCMDCSNYFGKWIRLDDDTHCHESGAWLSPVEATCEEQTTSADVLPDDTPAHRWEISQHGSFNLKASPRYDYGFYFDEYFDHLDGNNLLLAERTATSPPLFEGTSWKDEDYWTLPDFGCKAINNNVRIWLYPVLNQKPVFTVTATAPSGLTPSDTGDDWADYYVNRTDRPVFDVVINDPDDTLHDLEITGYRYWGGDASDTFDMTTNGNTNGTIALKNGVDLSDGDRFDFSITVYDAASLSFSYSLTLYVNSVFCGDDIVQSDYSEECDDGMHCENGSTCNEDSDCSGIGDGICSTRDGDGCDTSCYKEICGNNTVNPGEECDDGGQCPNGNLCSSDSDCSSGKCNPVSGDGCDDQCRYEECGNGRIDAGEECDNGMQCNNGTDCTCVSGTECSGGDWDKCTEEHDGCYPRGGDGCDQNCVSEVCGNEILQGDEECDDGNLVNGDGCDDECYTEECGNNRLDVGEECDDGDYPWSGDDCGDGCCNCELEGCGNGTLDANEDCDDGNTVDNDGCSATCVEEYCGDGVTQTNETCDDGNSDSGDGCYECKLEDCGDNMINDPEECDDGGSCANGDWCDTINSPCADGSTCTPQSNDGCSDSCREEVCGDGTVHTLNAWGDAEECDDGNTDDGDGCSANCELENCGDGDIDANEECDDGNNDNNDGCSDSCREEVCGDGTVQTLNAWGDAEECDDGNTDDGDGCSSWCTNEGCGNGIWEGSEECDDGNNDDGDGCSATCKQESCGDGIVQSPAEDCEPSPMYSCSDGKDCTECDDTGCRPDNTKCTGILDGMCEHRQGSGCTEHCRFESWCCDFYAEAGDNITPRHYSGCDPYSEVFFPTLAAAQAVCEPIVYCCFTQGCEVPYQFGLTLPARHCREQTTTFAWDDDGDPLMSSSNRYITKNVTQDAIMIPLSHVKGLSPDERGALCESFCQAPESEEGDETADTGGYCARAPNSDCEQVPSLKDCFSPDYDGILFSRWQEYCDYASRSSYEDPNTGWQLSNPVDSFLQ